MKKGLPDQQRHRTRTRSGKIKTKKNKVERPKVKNYILWTETSERTSHVKVRTAAVCAGLTTKPTSMLTEQRLSGMISPLGLQLQLLDEAITLLITDM